MPRKFLKDFNTERKDLSVFFGKEILNHYGTRKEFKKGTVIFREGEKGDYLFIVKSGKVRVFHEGKDRSEKVVAKLGAGSIVGEMAVITGKPRSASVMTIEDSVVYMIDRDSLFQIFKDYPNVREIIGLESIEREEENIKKLLDDEE